MRVRDRRVRAALLLLAGCSPGWVQAGGETPEIQVFGGVDVLAAAQISSSDTASLLSGIDSAQAGGVSGLPVIHGLDNDRIRTLVNGPIDRYRCQREILIMQRLRASTGNHS